MAELRVSDEHLAFVLEACLVARIAHADQGSAPSRVSFYATPWPGTVGAAPGAPALVECILAKPAGVVVEHAIVLVQADIDGDLIAVTGDALWAQWVAGNGDVVAEGDVSDETGTGAFKVAGTSGTTLYAGGRFFLATSALT